MLHKKPRAFRSEVGKIGSLSGKQKAAKEDSEGWHGRATVGTGRAMSLTSGVTDFCPIFRIFIPNQLLILFLLFQD